MPLVTCPHGHQWESSGPEDSLTGQSPSTCPFCQVTAETVVRGSSPAVLTRTPTAAAPLATRRLEVPLADPPRVRAAPALAGSSSPAKALPPLPRSDNAREPGPTVALAGCPQAAGEQEKVPSRAQTPTVKIEGSPTNPPLPAPSEPARPVLAGAAAVQTTPLGWQAPALPAEAERGTATVLPPPTPWTPSEDSAGAYPFTLPVPSGEAVGEARQTFGGYELLSVLGRGGMGIVYKARQIRLNRLVALKMILGGEHAGAEELARFRSEAEAVARLQHPNIVQIYEVGEEAGRPFFSLEFVEGGSLDRKLQGNPQPVRLAAQLVAQLARAIHAAHQRGIIHRDLKPANVLLQTDASQPAGLGIPKITDFGLAKRMDSTQGYTQTGSVMGTPSYMAPEQAAGKTREIGPPADIYALGAILYDLLTGRPPFRGETVFDTLQQVQANEPLPLIRLQPKVPRDLETICLKCLQKDPRKRYATAEDLAEDLQRFLEGEPITARPIAAWERVLKWTRRHPALAALIVVSVVSVLSLAASGLVLAEQQRRRADEALALRDLANQQRDRAEANFLHARAAVDQMLTGVGRQQLAHEPRMEKVRRDLLRKALGFYERFLEEKGTDPAVRWETGRAYQRVGDIHDMLGEHEPAEKAYRSARTFFAELAADFPDQPDYWRDLAACHNNLGMLLKETGQVTEAERAYRQALQLRQQLVEQAPHLRGYRQELAASSNNLGILLGAAGRIAEAEPILRQALQLQQELAQEATDVPAYRQELARSANNLGTLLAGTGRLAAAEEAFRQAQDQFQQLAAKWSDVPDYRQELAVSHYHLGNLWRDSQPHEAEKAYRQALKLRTELAADFPTMPIYRQELAASANSLGILLQAAGRRPEAETVYRQALAIKAKLTADFPRVPDYRQDLANSYNNRGLLLQTHNQLKEAEEAYRQSVALYTQLASDFPQQPDHQQELARAQLNLGTLLQVTGRPQQAEKASQEALRIRTQLAATYPQVPDYQQELARTHLNLGVLLQIQGQLPEAEKAYRQAADILTALADGWPKVPDYRHQLAVSCNNLGNLLQATQRPQEAEQAWRRALALLAQLVDAFGTVPVYRQELARSHNELAIFLASASRTQEAEQTWQQAMKLQNSLITEFPDKPDYRQELARSHGNLGIAMAKTNQLAKAEQQYRQAIALLEDLEAHATNAALYWPELIAGYTNLAHLLAVVGPVQEAEKSWRRVVALREKQVAAHPKVPTYRSELGQTFHELAQFLLERNKPEDARRCQEEAARHEQAAKLLADLQRKK